MPAMEHNAAATSERTSLLPDLRVLPLTALIPHEHVDAQRLAPLMQRLREEDVLRNPPIVAPLEANPPRFVVLDGANRVAALMAMGVPHVVAQVVDYAAVELHVWHHALIRCEMPPLLNALHTLAALAIEPSDWLAARAALARREALALLLTREAHDTNACFVLSGGHNLRARTELLNRVVALCASQAEIQRTISDDLSEVRRAFPEATGLMVFPRYEPAEIMDLARSGVRLPPGITRHVLPLRVLHLDYPLALLRSAEPIAHKQAQLTAWLQARFAQRRVRTYAEPTMLFDE